MLSNFEYLIDGDGEDADHIEEQCIFKIVISYFNGIFPQQSILVETGIEIYYDADQKDDDGWNVQNLEKTLVIVQ